MFAEVEQVSDRVQSEQEAKQEPRQNLRRNPTRVLVKLSSTREIPGEKNYFWEDLQEDGGNWTTQEAGAKEPQDLRPHPQQWGPAQLVAVRVYLI